MVFVRETQQTQQQLTQKNKTAPLLVYIYIHIYISSQERTTKNNPRFITLGAKNPHQFVFQKSTRTCHGCFPKVLQRLDASGHHLHPRNLSRVEFTYMVCCGKWKPAFHFHENSTHVGKKTKKNGVFAKKNATSMNCYDFSFTFFFDF